MYITILVLTYMVFDDNISKNPMVQNVRCCSIFGGVSKSMRRSHILYKLLFIYLQPHF